MFSTQYGKNQPKFSHYTRAIWPLAGNELGLINYYHAAPTKCKENVSNSPTSIGIYCKSVACRGGVWVVQTPPKFRQS
jgi:hypothetical protein